MEDNKNHIDDFFLNRLQDVEADADIASRLNIFHSLHPTDLALHDLLNSAEIDIDNSIKTGIFTALQNTAHPIDSALHDNLRNLQSEPVQAVPLPIQSDKKKRRIAFWWAIPLVLSILAVGYFIQKDLLSLVENNPNNSNSNTTQNSENIEENTSKLNSEITSKSSSELNSNKNLSSNENIENNSFQSENLKNNSSINKYPKKDNSTSNNLFNQIQKNSNSKLNDPNSKLDNYKGNTSYNDEEIIQYLRFSKLYPFKIPLEFEATIGKISPPIKYPEKGFISPFGIGFGIGYQQESILSTKTKTENLHKDFVNNFKNSSNKKRSGIHMFFIADYQIGNRIKVRTGANYSSTSVTTRFDYVYDNVPLYNPDGSIKGYFTRPQQGSPQVHQDITTSSSSFSIPVQVLYKLFSSEKLSIWTGGGMQLNTMHKKYSKVFSFGEEGLIDIHKSGLSKLQGNYSIQMHYKLKAAWSLQFIAQSNYQNEYVEFEGVRMYGNSIIPSFNIGLVYNPILRKK